MFHGGRQPNTALQAHAVPIRSRLEHASELKADSKRISLSISSKRQLLVGVTSLGSTSPRVSHLSAANLADVPETC